MCCPPPAGKIDSLFSPRNTRKTLFLQYALGFEDFSTAVYINSTAMLPVRQNCNDIWHKLNWASVHVILPISRGIPSRHIRLMHQYPNLRYGLPYSVCICMYIKAGVCLYVRMSVCVHTLSLCSYALVAKIVNNCCTTYAYARRREREIWRRISSALKIGFLDESPLKVLCLLKNHVPELLGGQVVEFHIESERLLGHRLVCWVVVRLQVRMRQRLQRERQDEYGQPRADNRSNLTCPTSMRRLGSNVKSRSSRSHRSLKSTREVFKLNWRWGTKAHVEVQPFLPWAARCWQVRRKKNFVNYVLVSLRQWLLLAA